MNHFGNLYQLCPEQDKTTSPTCFSDRIILYSRIRFIRMSVLVIAATADASKYIPRRIVGSGADIAPLHQHSKTKNTPE
jgi:hypothetical protein